MKNNKSIAVKARQKKITPIKTEKMKSKGSKKVLKQKLSKSPSKVTTTPIVTVQKKIKYMTPSKVVTENLVTACLNALEKLTTLSNKKNTIFGDETQIFMEIRCIKILKSKGNVKFTLPNSTMASSGEVCLITPDLKKGKKVDHEPTVDHWEEILRKAGVTAVKTVLPMRQLRVEYDQYELKRRLLTQHDFIMVDTRVLNHVSHVLGKMFFKKHNMLIPVKINEKKDVKKNIDVGLRTVMLRLNEGQTSTILVGNTAMQQSLINENILAIVRQLKEKFPGGENNIRSLSIKLPLSLSIPLYLTLRPSGSVKTIKIKKTKPKNYKDYEDELTTHIGYNVRVAPDGTVHLKRKLNQSDASDIEDQESSENEDGEDKKDQE
ncbi:ribosomal L1 domain-containing protein CG13096 [Vanessa atalanta]|uniref:ribosomal L1 domain-containing protein CG13096 n=1 Tax=Vanessa atalanta TaxID=42275 RepID=UPI001FCD0F7F|nr:ribosomal L1 domain-containing protein CG13096 [Vanessa atalanta]